MKVKEMSRQTCHKSKSIDKREIKISPYKYKINFLYLFYICCSRKVTVCPKSSDPFHIISYYIKWVTTSWTHSTLNATRPQKQLKNLSYKP